MSLEVRIQELPAPVVTRPRRKKRGLALFLLLAAAGAGAAGYFLFRPETGESFRWTGTRYH